MAGIGRILVRLGVKLALILLLALPPAPGAAQTDSCWMHNGSLMRLVASGTGRAFYYEDPRPALRAAGVARGTLLFHGHNRQGWYSGHAWVFSRYCPSNPLQYRVEGPVSDGQRRVTMHGTRPVYRQCQPTGQRVTDTLVFTYSHRC